MASVRLTQSTCDRACGNGQGKCLSSLPECSAERGRRDTGGMLGRKCTSHTCSHAPRYYRTATYVIIMAPVAARGPQREETLRGTTPTQGEDLSQQDVAVNPAVRDRKKKSKDMGVATGPPLPVTVPRARDVRTLTNQGCILRALY